MSAYKKPAKRCLHRKKPCGPAFTIIELLVVICVVTTLACLLFPAIKTIRATSAKSQCASNLRHLGAAITLFANDHSATFPPGADGGEYVGYGWDVYIDPYISGRTINRQEQMIIGTNGVMPRAQTPGILLCPADTGPDTVWVASADQSGTLYGRRTYAMNAAGPGNGSGQFVGQFNPSTPYTLPPVNQGVGVYWEPDFSANPLNAPGYSVSVVVQPGETILLAEQPNGRNTAGDQWPAICLAPYSGSSSPGAGDEVQIAPAASNNEGLSVYQSHGSNFNYLFHDNSVRPYRIEQTVGPGSTNYNGSWSVPAGGGYPAASGQGPKGFWTIKNPYGNH